LEGGNGGGLIAQFDRQGDHLLTTDWTSLWKLWDLRTGQQLLSLPAAGTCLQFHTRGDQIAADAGVSTHVRLLRYRPGNEMQSLVHWSYEPLEGVPQPKRRGGKPHEPYPLPVPFERHTLATIDPQGRLLAVGTENGTALVNLTRWEEVGLLPLPRHNPLAFAGDGSLWTYGPTGIHRWPAPQDTSGDQLQFGPPERLFSYSNIDWHGISADGATIAIPNYREGALVWSQANQQQVRLPAGGDVRSCAVSPDGRWVATGAHGLSTVKVAGARIWDARSGKHLRDLAVQPFCGVWFSPDGSWLATLVPGQECQLWKSGSWEPGPRLPYVGFDRRAVFTRDGSLLALQGEPGTLRLIQPETGVELARLITSEELPLVPLCFTPDGSQLIAMGYEGQSLHRFDLRAIQAGLTELGLDWQLPPFSDVGSPVRLSPP
jgi:WD40 repeat protein